MPKKKKRKSSKKKKGKKGWCVKAGSKTVSKHRKKSVATKKAKARQKAGKKGRVVPCTLRRRKKRK